MKTDLPAIALLALFAAVSVVRVYGIAAPYVLVGDPIVLNNPTPAASERFGETLSRFGSNKIAVGSVGAQQSGGASSAFNPGVGEAYILSTNGMLLATLRNPAPVLNDRFGASVSTLDAQFIVVGEPFDDAQGNNSGAVHLFRADGSYLRTVVNPSSVFPEFDAFGASVVGLGSNFFAVGAALATEATIPVGRVSIHDISGAMITTDVGRVHLYPLSFSFPDPFEPDDRATQPRPTRIGQEAAHNVHNPGDEDGMKFYAVSNHAYTLSIEEIGTNADVVLDVYFQSLDGSLVPVATNITTSKQKTVLSGPGASLSLTNPASGTYLVRAKDADPTVFGDSSAYAFSVDVPAPGPTLSIIVVDLLSPNGAFAPSNTMVSVDSGAPIAMNGINTITLFAIFTFLPFAQLDASVRDGLSGAWLAASRIVLRSTSGPLSGVELEQFPGVSEWGTLWATDVAGAFPGDVVVPQGTWDLIIRREGYPDLVVSNAITGQGSQVQLAEVLLFEPDSNTNGMGDVWEQTHFVTNAAPLEDSDGDGHHNLAEFRAGTDPTNAHSVLSLSLWRGEDAINIRWPVAEGRSYSLECTTSLSSQWSRVLGPVIPGRYESALQWSDTNAFSGNTRSYRVELD